MHFVQRKVGFVQARRAPGQLVSGTFRRRCVSGSGPFRVLRPAQQFRWIAKATQLRQFGRVARYIAKKQQEREMDQAEIKSRELNRTKKTTLDAVVIGAGIAGLYQLHRLRQLGLKVRAFEAGSGIGGTWYWNRYPGARFDSESWTYGYSFSQELLKEWRWQEHFAPQPETERYLNYVADKFDLRRDIQFDSRVASAHYRDDTRSWDIALEDG